MEGFEKYGRLIARLVVVDGRGSSAARRSSPAAGRLKQTGQIVSLNVEGSDIVSTRRSRPIRLGVDPIARILTACWRMKTTASAQDLKQLIAGDPISLGAALRVLHDHQHLMEDEITCANSLLSGAGDYLGRWWIRRFIRGEISDDEARQEIQRQRTLVDRLRRLFPSLIYHLKIQDHTRANISFNIVFECCSDYPIILASGRKDANKKRLVQKIEKMCQSVNHLNVLLDDRDVTGEHDFQSIHTAYLKYVHQLDEEARPFWQLQNDLRFLASYFELRSHRARKQPDFLFVPDNQAKTHIVDCAYGLSLSEDSPPFVTTPGSDFSMMCSIIFEIATGTRDESLAGAINRFGRSKDKREADDNEIEYSGQNDKLRDEDNFYDIKQAIAGSSSRIANLRETLVDPMLSREAAVLVQCQLLEALETVEKNEKQHGPFIMWASQMSVDWDEHMREHDEIEALRLRLDIELGERQRNMRAKLT